ncbi:MAG: hypothetical protein CCU26_08245 [Nitrospira sp. UW-LDO-01]|nr:MAG: hypothetical protein CCU26_08245 [Nitrospira sp. UW-LDO-01]
MTAVWCQVNPKAAMFLGILTVVIGDMSFASGVWPSTETSDGLQIEITRRGAGKQVVLSQGTREWFMLIEVTPENAVILKQEKEQDRYLIDESETHDRPMTVDEVDAAITDYVNSVKARVRKK